MTESTTNKAIITVAEMARMCGLSRSRFYGLIGEGIMPQPSRNPETQRPFYNREQQEQCLLVRKSHCGINGQPVLFYAQRPSVTAGAPPRRTTRTPTPQRSRPPQRTDPVILDLQHGLEQLGLPDVAESKIRIVLAQSYPDGYNTVPASQLLMTAFRGLRQEGTENA